MYGPGITKEPALQSCSQTGSWADCWVWILGGSLATESVRRNWFTKNEATWFHVSVLSRLCLSTPTRWLAVHRVNLAKWWRGTGLGNNNPDYEHEALLSWKELSCNVVCVVDWWPFAWSFENEGGAESDWPGWEPCVPWFTATGNATERTNDSERFFLANWPTQTESRKRIMKSISSVDAYVDAMSRA